MREVEARSELLQSTPGIRHGFLTNHIPGGRMDAAEPPVATVKQVHGSILLWTDRVEKRAREADALATERPELAVGVYSADCTPILLAGLQGSRPLAVMAVHAGWRGTAAGIAGLSLSQFAARLQADGADRFLAAIGPCIGPESFEVGEEVIEAFPGSMERGQARFLRLESGKKKFLFDLPGENMRQLQDMAARQNLNLTLDWISHCTLQRAEEYPSFRRDREKAGRILSFIAFER